ncbi:hypothetical protein [Desulfobacca acetoxidans]
MDRIKNAAIILRLIDKLREKGSWCGETHIQKATFFLQELMQVPMEFDFILYKHGPFSFDLRDELTALRADGLIELEPRWPCGPRLASTDLNEYIQKLYSNTIARYDKKITFIAEILGDKGVTELERLATALYVTKNRTFETLNAERAEELTELKPHITLESAKNAIEEIDSIMNEARVHIH